MSLQHHYIAVFDSETEKWSIDFEVSINFDEGRVWNTETQEWSFSKDEGLEDIIIGDLAERLTVEK